MLLSLNSTERVRMMINKLQFRPARASDVEDAVPLIYSSGPIAFDYVFANKKGNAEGFLRYAFQDGAGEFGYRNHVVGTIDGKVACIGAGFTGESGLSFMLSAIRQIINFYGLFQSPSVIIKGLRMEQVIKPPAAKLYYIAHLGVAPELQGQGIGTQLLNHLLSPEYTAGCSMAALDVAVTNPRAETLYERLGFTVTGLSESRLSSEWGTVANLRRMEKQL